MENSPDSIEYNKNNLFEEIDNKTDKNTYKKEKEEAETNAINIANKKDILEKENDPESKVKINYYPII